MGLQAVNTQSLSSVEILPHELQELDNQIHLLQRKRDVLNLVRQALLANEKNEEYYRQFCEGYITTVEFIQHLNIPDFIPGLRYELSLAYLALNEAKSIQGVK